MEIVEWRHPRHGRILDVVCPRHGSDLLRALHTLGIGCTGRRIDLDRCGRCEAESAGVEARFYLGLAAAPRDEPSTQSPRIGHGAEPEPNVIRPHIA